MLEQITVNCPYCGEVLHASVDQANGHFACRAQCPVCFCNLIFRASLLNEGRFQRVIAIRDGTEREAF